MALNTVVQGNAVTQVRDDIYLVDVIGRAAEKECDIGVMVVYPSWRHLISKERVMVDFLAETSRGLPASDQGLLNPRISHPLPLRYPILPPDQ
ncbi:hypothetical protein [Rhizobium leguminosarum]|uniref:hypothetical protein n=1 Tax=Rhizobium leguminosarum TaxID=384 RepID=UPI0013E93895|nr:hypothetical protein [Rhizobium leguminosarum]